MNRRSFLKILGGTAAATLAAPLIMPSTGPLFIPSDRLDMGVPRRILTATEMPPRPFRVTEWAELAQVGDVPMLLAHDEFRPPGWEQFGRQKVPAGTTLLVDRTTAERWIEHGVGTPGPAAPMDLQTAAAVRMAERRLWKTEDDDPYGPRLTSTDENPMAVIVRQDPIEVLRERQAERDRTRDQRWSAMVERASATLKRAERTPEMAWWDNPPRQGDDDWPEWAG